MLRVRPSFVMLASLGLLALTGCALVPGASQPALSLQNVVPGAAAPSIKSQKMAAYFRKYQVNLLTRGLLRRDGGGPDVPFSARNLADNFIKIAFFDEYSDVGGRMVARPAPRPLRRWQGPLRMAVTFGPTVPVAQQGMDRANLAAYSSRLARLTGLSIRQTDTNPNVRVLVLNEDERAAAGPLLHRIAPELSTNSLRDITDMPRTTFCAVYPFGTGANPNIYARAIIVIRAELPDLLRLSCIHEELAQSLGLPNDDPTVRPSIFNDDEEFGLLTTQDELMLKILYDKSLSPGMTARAARPSVERIAARLRGGTT